MKEVIKLPWNVWTDKLTGGVEPEHVVMYTINNSTPADAPFVRRVISTSVRGTGRAAIITATIEVFDGNIMMVVLEPNPLEGWGYMFKSGGKYQRHFGRPSALTRTVKGAIA